MTGRGNAAGCSTADREAVLSIYFQAWVDKNPRPLERVFAPDVIYSECFGPVYVGLEQIRQWFADWNRNGAVREWHIQKFVHQDAVTVAEWFFRCIYKGCSDAFSGVSWVEFNEREQIRLLKEFQSKAEHVYPYGAARTHRGEIDL